VSNRRKLKTVTIPVCDFCGEPGHRWVEGAPGHFVQGITDPQWKAGQELWVGRGQAAAEAKGAAGHDPVAAVTEFAGRAAAAVPGILGGGRQDWSGKVVLFDQADDPAAAARLRWNGDMAVEAGLAARLRDQLAGTGPVELGDLNPFVTVLHELIHGTVPEGQTHAMQAAAYIGAAREIEEGFTELGMAQHAAEYLNAVGIGGRETPVIATEGGHAADRRATAAEYAERLSDPARIERGEAWQHYGWQTAAALTWAQAAADAGAAAGWQAVADEVNREGVAGKVPAMARQVMRAAGVADQETGAGKLSELVADTIRKRWALGPATAKEPQAWDAAAETARRLAEPPEVVPEPQRASGVMKPGDWQGQYQAIGQAPLSYIAGERSRYVTLDGVQHHVSGAWSDPWWMARPKDQGGGWAVSRRWKSAAQKSYRWESGKGHTIEIPARDEQVLTPWYPGGAWTGGSEAEARARETGRPS
jgi:hypothetical protein